LRKVLEIEQIIKIGNKKGMMVLPYIPDSFWKEDEILPTTVEIRSKSGKSHQRGAHFTIPRMNHPEDGYLWVCVLPNATQKMVQVGDEVWINAK